MNTLSLQEVHSPTSALGGWKRLIAWLAFAAAFFTLVDAALPQLRMFLTDGASGSPRFFLKPALAFSILAAFITYGFQPGFRKVVVPWLLFVGYLIFLIGFNSYRNIGTAKDLAVSLVDSYTLTLFLPLVLSLQALVNQKVGNTILLVTFLGLAILGISQHFSGEYLVYASSRDGLFLAGTPTAQGEVRGFSLFTSPLRFGYYITLLLPLAVATFFYAKRPVPRFWFAIICVVGAFGLYSTLTRNATILTIEALGTLILIRSNFRYIKIIPLVWLSVSTFIGFIAPILSPLLGSDHAFLSGTSLAQRMESWVTYGEAWLQEDSVMALFGTGISQFLRDNAGGQVVIDNMYLAAGNQIGLIGMILLLLVLWQMWALLVDTLLSFNPEERAPMLVAGVSCWSTLLAAGLFNVSYPIYISLFTMILLISPRAKTQAADSRYPASDRN